MYIFLNKTLVTSVFEYVVYDVQNYANIFFFNTFSFEASVDVCLFVCFSNAWAVYA